jgi:hypothetical protein
LTQNKIQPDQNKLNASINASSKITSNDSEWKEISESPASEFFDGIEFQPMPTKQPSFNTISTQTQPSQASKSKEELENELVTAIGSLLEKMEEKANFEPPFEQEILVSSLDELQQNSSKIQLHFRKRESPQRNTTRIQCALQLVSSKRNHSRRLVRRRNQWYTQQNQFRHGHRTNAEIIKYMEPIISNGFQGLKTAPGVTHVIELLDQKPFREKYRADPHSKRADFNKLLNELIHHKIIVESKSPYSLPPHV